MGAFSKQLKVMYVANTITASRGTIHALCRQAPDFNSTMVHHHATVAEICAKHDLDEKEVRAGWTIFSTVRDPRDWMVSRYCKEVGPMMVPNVKHFRTWYIQGIRGATQPHPEGQRMIFYMHWDDVNNFAKYEQLEDDLTMLVGRDIKLGRDPVHKTKYKEDVPHWSEFWTPQMEEYFRSAVRDFERFRY